MATEEYIPCGDIKPTSTPYFKQSNVLQNGVLLLGRIKEIFETKVIVALPAKMCGFVMACHISNPYNKYLQAHVDDKIEEVQSIRSLFKKGEYVVVRVIEVAPNNKQQVILSMMPEDVNREFDISKVQEGAVLRGAIESKEDDGYVVDLGIKGCHAFMPLNLVDESCNLVIGQVIWCTVTKSDNANVIKSDNANVIKVSNKLEVLRDAVVKQEHDRKTLDCILPGMAVEFNINQVLPNGIEGQFFGDTTGYIMRAQMDLLKEKKPDMGERIKARLLYVLPTTKLPFFTMKNIFENSTPNLEEEIKLSVGQFVEDVKVISVTGTTIIFQLGLQCVGKMTLKHIKIDLDLDDADFIKKSYPIGSEHRVRILNYYLCDYMYECTDDRKLLSEKVFSDSDLSTGQIVDATISAIEDHGIQLKVGGLYGFVPTIHLLDVGLSIQKNEETTTKNKFEIDQPVRARVLTLDPENNRFILTLKSSLLDPDMEVLKSYNDAAIGKQYKGVIASVRKRIVVTFFEDVRAMITPEHASREHIEDLSTAFHVGEIALCTILYVNPEKKTIAASFTHMPFKLGQKKKTITGKLNINKKKRKIEQQKPTGEKNKSKKTKKQVVDVVPEESSGVESVDFNEMISSDLTEKEAKLLNSDNCVTREKCKKRVISLIETINKKIVKIDKCESVIEKIENKVITTRNKELHTKIKGLNKLILQEQVNLFMEEVTFVQAKLRAFPPEETELAKRKLKKVKENEAERNNKDVDYNSGVTDDTNMAENLEQDSIDLPSESKVEHAVNTSTKSVKLPSLDLPSVKDF